MFKMSIGQHSRNVLMQCYSNWQRCRMYRGLNFLRMRINFKIIFLFHLFGACYYSIDRLGESVINYFIQYVENSGGSQRITVIRDLSS